MGNATILILFFLIILLMIVVILILFLKVKAFEKKQINFSPTEAYTIMESMREIIRESERVADRLDESIRTREQAMEDLADIVESKLIRLDNIISKSKGEKDIRRSILELHESGLPIVEIAKRLEISVTEVQITLNILNNKI